MSDKAPPFGLRKFRIRLVVWEIMRDPQSDPLDQNAPVIEAPVCATEADFIVSKIEIVRAMLTPGRVFGAAFYTFCSETLRRAANALIFDHEQGAAKHLVNWLKKEKR